MGAVLGIMIIRGLIVVYFPLVLFARGTLRDASLEYLCNMQIGTHMTQAIFRAFAAATLGLGLFCAAAPAIAGPTAGSTYQLRATVPVACWVKPASSLLVGQGRSGEVIEACNSPGGFTVSAQYRPLSPTEKAQMFYGDRMFELDKSGGQILRRSSIATIRSVSYRFDEVDLDQPLILALTIQPI